MKLILLLAAIYTMIYHQSRKVDELAQDVPAKSIYPNYQHQSTDEADYHDGYLFSSFNSGNVEVQPPTKGVYQQKQVSDHRYPFYQPTLGGVLK